MGILRTDIVSHSQLEATGGSLELDGVGDYLTFGAHSSFAPATADVTFELWFYLTDQSDFSAGSGNYYFFDMGSNGYRIQMYEGLIRFGVDGSNWTPPASGVSKNVWHHVAGVRESNSLDLYLDGNHVGQKTMTSSVTSTSLTIGNYGGAPYDGEPYGYISNFRYVRGVVYKGPFTPPKFELKNIPGTIVLGCQSSSSATDFAVTPSTITAQGNATSSAFHPGLKKDITDTGVVFDGVTTFDSQAFMVPPSGKTTERNRGRGIIAGGCTPLTSSIDLFNIQSQGNSIKFGSLQSGAIFGNQMCASSTRGISGGGAQPTIRNFLDFITIATESNSTDFGDLQSSKRDIGALSNQTRGIWTGGNPGSSPNTTDQIDFVTIATTGDASDFGNLTASMKEVQSTSSPTRGIMGGGNTVPATINTIQFITIASTGNASDFGDLTRTASSLGAVSSGTRGVFANGGSNTIDFITIASAGNASDFGDSTLLRAQCTATMSNSIRGVFAGGYQPSPNSTDTNTVDFITIATIGNASDFGDISRLNDSSNREGGGCSDSHGGLE